jgi:hypothetical protein
MRLSAVSSRALGAPSLRAPSLRALSLRAPSLRAPSLWAVSLCALACDDETPTGDAPVGAVSGTSTAGVSAGGVEPPVGGEPPLGGASVGGASVGGASVGGASVGGASVGGASAGAGSASGAEAGAGAGTGAGGAAPSGECRTGQSRCVAGTPSAIERCNVELQWSVNPCPEGTACALDECLPIDCVEGQRRCLDQRTLLECAGGEWQRAEECFEACAVDSCTTTACAVAARERSYLGCEYMAIELPNLVSRDPGAPPVAVVLTNASATEPAHVTIFNPEGEVMEPLNDVVVAVPMDIAMSYSAQTVRSEVRDASGQVVMGSVMRAEQTQIPPGGVATFLLPQTTWPEAGSVVGLKAHRVVSDLPVGAYQFAPYCCNYSFSNDASLLIPTSALSGSYRFLGVPNLLSFDELFTPVSIPTNMTIVATRDATTLRFTLPPNASVQPESTGRLTVERGAYTVTLNRQETLLLRSDTTPNPNPFLPEPQTDFTGAVIESSEPVAVFSAHECAYYPTQFGACDHLEEQLFPLEAWGNTFTLVPPKERGRNAIFERIYWKLLSYQPGARVRLSASFSDIGGAGPGAPGVPDCGQLLDPQDRQVIVIGAEGFCEFSTKVGVDISSDQPISVMGIISGQESVEAGAGFGAHLGDPSIFLATPTRQYRSDYAFLTPNTYYSDFVAVVFEPGTSMRLDGQEVDLSGATQVRGSQRRYAYLPLEDGPHTLVGSAPFGIMVFAFDDFVSYAFTGGLNLTKR